MKTFFYILQKVVNTKVIRYPDEPIRTNTNIFTVIEDDIILNMNLYSLICKIYQTFNTSNTATATASKIFKRFANSKINCLLNFFKNPFNSEKIKINIRTAFIKAQRTYHALIRFVNIYKMKKYPIVVSDDLSMCPIDIHNKNTIVLIQNKSKYCFVINDLIRIIETAIGNSPSFFADPLRPKNPFNNEEFDNATLYNIYFKMKECGCLTSTIFHLYFLSNFNNKLFALQNEAFLREYAIHKYVYNSHAMSLYSATMEMIKEHVYTNKLTIHKDFPKDLLVNIFRPFLYYYFITLYDIKGTHKISKYKQILYFKLKKFYKYNKSFGRKMIQILPQSPNSIFNNNNNNNNLNLLVDTSSTLSTSWSSSFTSSNAWASSTSATSSHYKRKTKYVFNSNHINFYNIDISEMNSDQDDIFEGANLLYYFGVYANMDDDTETNDSVEVMSHESDEEPDEQEGNPDHEEGEEEEEEEEDDEEENPDEEEDEEEPENPDEDEETTLSTGLLEYDNYSSEDDSVS